LLTQLNGPAASSFPFERAIFLTVLHRLFAPGSDRAAEKWKVEDPFLSGRLRH